MPSAAAALSSRNQNDVAPSSSSSSSSTPATTHNTTMSSTAREGDAGGDNKPPLLGRIDGVVRKVDRATWERGFKSATDDDDSTTEPDRPVATPDDGQDATKKRPSKHSMDYVMRSSTLR